MEQILTTECCCHRNRSRIVDFVKANQQLDCIQNTSATRNRQTDRLRNYLSIYT